MSNRPIEGQEIVERGEAILATRGLSSTTASQDEVGAAYEQAEQEINGGPVVERLPVVGGWVHDAAVAALAKRGRHSYTPDEYVAACEVVERELGGVRAAVEAGEVVRRGDGFYRVDGRAA